MSKKIIGFWLIFMLFGVSLGFAQNASRDDLNLTKEISSRLKNKMKSGALFLLGIEERLDSNKDELKLLKDNVKSIEKKISESAKLASEVQSQIGNLNYHISLNEQRIAEIQILAAATENEILVASSESEALKKHLRDRSEKLGQFLTAAYIQTNALFDAESGKPRLFAFLQDQMNSTGDTLKKQDYLFFLEQASQDIALDMLQSQNILDDKQSLMELKKKKLKTLDALLAREKKTLKQAQDSKERLLRETLGRQAVYETLLEISKREIENSELQIRRLKENYAFFQAKLASLKEDSVNEMPLPEISELKNSASPLSWPVSPSLGLSAFYLDSEYEKALGVKHYGADIRIPQGSKVRAAADGVVTKVADNGFAYSYIIIAHPGNLITLYGHLSEMLVREGEIVRQGQVIGLSGGIPGTKGAGWLTTGAHVHLEVFENFQQKDPLDYLPLELVPVSLLPEDKIKKLTQDMALRQN